MFTRKARNIIFVLVLVLSIGLAPTVRAEIMIEPNGVCWEIMIEPNGVATRSK